MNIWKYSSSDFLQHISHCIQLPHQQRHCSCSTRATVQLKSLLASPSSMLKSANEVNTTLGVRWRPIRV